MANGCCGQLRHVAHVCLSCKCELNGCHDGAHDHVRLFCDGVLDMAHTHAFLQEKEDGSIEEIFASFYNYEEDELRDCLTKKHWEYAATSIGLDSKPVSTKPFIPAAPF